MKRLKLIAGGRRHGGGDGDDDDDGGWGRRGGYVKTHSKHKSNFNMAHSHERGQETFRRIRRDYGEGGDDK